jgi:glycosyltransferase involved in cell wall biosynthesis
MRALLVSQEYPPETHWGGIATYLGTLAPALAGLGVEVHVLSVAPGQDRSSVERDGVVVHRAPLRQPPGVGRLSRLPWTWGRVALAANVASEARRLALDPDVIEATLWNAEALFLARRRGRAALVVHVFSSAAEILPMLGPANRDKRWAAALEARLVRSADLVTGTPGQLSKAGPRLGLDGDRVRHITCPVALLPEPPPFDGPPTVCFVGRLEPRKGPDVLVRAWPKVVAEIPGARLVLNGHDTTDDSGASFAAHLRDLARDGAVEGSVVVNERWGDYQTVLDEMASSSVCVMPSRWESFGYVAAEASSLGRPVVASDIPALAEVVDPRRTGLLAPPDDVDAWATALVELLADPQGAGAMGAAGRAKMRSERAPEVIAARTVEIYEEAIGRRSRSWR